MPHHKRKTTFYTLVQHSAFVFDGDLRFEHAVEPRVLSTQGEVTKVATAGGVIESDWRAINKRADSENFPVSRKSTMALPHATGTFSSVTIEGQCLYIPARTDANT
jgi:hypothetical protein